MMMKKFLKILVVVLLGILLQSCFVSKNSNMSFLDNEDIQGANITSINVPTFLAKTVIKNKLNNDAEAEEIGNMISKVKKVRVMTLANSSEKINRKLSDFLASNHYNEWMSIMSNGQKIKINAQGEENIRRLLISINSDKGETVFVDVKGDFTPDDISKLVNATQESKNLTRTK